MDYMDSYEGLEELFNFKNLVFFQELGKKMRLSSGSHNLEHFAHITWFSLRSGLVLKSMLEEKKKVT